MNERTTAWYNVGSVSRVEIMVSAAMLNAARGLSEMVKTPITMGTVQARMVDFSDIAAGVGHPETEMVGIYLEMKGELGGQAILIMPLPSALALAGLLIGHEPGASTALDEEARSALAEVGHLMVAYFLNAMAVLTGKPLRPSPPAVMVDMLGSIVGVLVTSVAGLGDQVMIFETILQEIERHIEMRFWVLPDLASHFTTTEP